MSATKIAPSCLLLIHVSLAQMDREELSGCEEPQELWMILAGMLMGSALFFAAFTVALTVRSAKRVKKELERRPSYDLSMPVLVITDENVVIDVDNDVCLLDDTLRQQSEQPVRQRSVADYYDVAPPVYDMSSYREERAVSAGSRSRMGTIEEEPDAEERMKSLQVPNMTRNSSSAVSGEFDATEGLMPPSMRSTLYRTRSQVSVERNPA